MHSWRHQMHSWRRGWSVGGVIRDAPSEFGTVVAALRRQRHPIGDVAVVVPSLTTAPAISSAPRARKIFTSASGAAAAARKMANPEIDMERPFFNVAERFGIASRRFEFTPEQRQLAVSEPLVPGLGSFRFPPSVGGVQAGEEAAAESLRSLASAHRDPALAHTLGARFAGQALAKFNSPAHKHGTLDPLISEFSIGSPEGVALLQLAEALIRLPPEARGMPATLVRDKLARGDLDFFSHARSDKSVLVNGREPHTLVPHIYFHNLRDTFFLSPFCHCQWQWQWQWQCQCQCQ